MSDNGEATTEQVSEVEETARVKKQFPEAKFRLTVEDEDGTERVFYLKKIARVILEKALRLLGKNTGPEMILAGEVILTSCWVTGYEKIKTDEEMLVAAAMQCFELIEYRSTTLKKI